jgi:hypothetical protein
VCKKKWKENVCKKNDNLTCVEINIVHATCVFFFFPKVYVHVTFCWEHMCFSEYLFYNITPIQGRASGSTTASLTKMDPRTCVQVNF